MFAGFDYGPFIDPVLLDLCLKVSILGGVILLIALLVKHAKRTRDELSRIQPPEAIPEQVLELKRQIAFHVADVEKYSEEIGRLRRDAEERADEFTGLFNKYVDLLHTVEEVETQLSKMPHVGKISISARATRESPENTLLAREPTLPPPNPKSLTKFPAVADRVQTLKLPQVKKPIPREE